MFETFPRIRILEFGLPGLALVLLYLAFHLLKSRRCDQSERAAPEPVATSPLYRLPTARSSPPTASSSLTGGRNEPDRRRE